MSKQKLSVIVTAAIGIVAILFLPFIKFGISRNILSALPEFGVPLLLAFGAVLILALLAKEAPFKKGFLIGILVCAIIAFLVLAIIYLALADAGGTRMLASGFWLAMLTSIAIPVVLFAFKNK